MRNESLHHYVELLIELIRKELKIRYRSSILGYIWSVVQPLMLTTVFFMAFRWIMRIPVENYAFLLVTGLFPWQWLSNSAQASATVYLSNSELVKKVAFRRSLLPLATVVNDMLHFIVTIPVIVVTGWFHGFHPSTNLLVGLPLVIAAQAFMCYGIALVIGAINPFFRDVERLVSVVLLVLFYCTPIIYPAELVPEGYRLLFYLNPATSLIEAYRGLFLHSEIAVGALLISFAWGGLLMLLGYRTHLRLSWKLAEVL